MNIDKLKAAIKATDTTEELEALTHLFEGNEELLALAEDHASLLLEDIFAPVEGAAPAKAATIYSKAAAAEEEEEYVPSARKVAAVAAAVAEAAVMVEIKPAAPVPSPAPLAAKRFPRTEFGNADRMVAQFGDDLMYVEDLAQWYEWTGVHWEPASEASVHEKAKRTVLALPDEAKHIADDEDRQKFLEFASRSQKAAMVKNMEVLARTDATLRVKASELDGNVFLLGVKNGAVDLRTGALVAPDRKARLTTHAAASYDPAATCPVWVETVLGVFGGDKELAAFFQRLMGYTLMGNPTEDAIVIPFGDGSNGKSTTLGTVRKVMGGYARTADAGTFLDNGKGGGNAGGPREDVLRLRGARFVYVSEPEEGSVLKESFVKAMTGGDPMPARGVNAKRTIEVMPTWVPVMPTNHRPIIKGDDYAIWRRIMTVPFLMKFDKEKSTATGGADINREEKLIAEADGILTWLVQGALEYQRMGLGVPAPVKEAKAAYKEDMDLLGEWLEECCVNTPGAFATNAELWASWQEFAMAKGELRFISSSRGLGHKLANRYKSDNVRIGGAKTRGFWGLRVKGIHSAINVEASAKAAQRELAEVPF